MDQLKFAVIHSLDKEAQSSLASVRRAAAPLDVHVAEVKSLADQLAKLVGRDGSTVFWGQFGANNREGRFPGSVELLTASPDVATFMTVSHVAMEELLRAAADEPLSTGGYVCFVVYETNGAHFLLVAMIKERGALTLSETLVPTEIKQIDLSKLHQAARVNLERYSEFLQQGEEPAEDEERTYLCFVNRSGRQEVARYFIEALGCEKGVSSARATRSAVDAVRKFVASKPEIKDQARMVRRAVIDHMHAMPDGATMTISTLVSIVRVALGDELAEHIDDLGSYLNGEEAQVPESFSVSAKYIKSVTRITAQAEGWKLSFDDTELSESDAPIVYNRNEKSLKITVLADETVKRIEDALSQRRA